MDEKSIKLKITEKYWFDWLPCNQFVEQYWLEILIGF